MNISLKDRVAVITGGSRGLGKAMALAMAEAGASVVLVGRNQAALEAAAGQLAAGRHSLEVCNVCQEAAVEALGRQVLERYGHADILVNNAGINIRKPLTEFSFGEWQSVVATNLFGPMLCSRVFLPAMIERRWGRILNMASMMATIALPGRTAYCASKGGLAAMTRLLALEVAAHGITVNSISPGPFATEMNIPLLQDPVTNAQFISRIPVGRWGRVEEIGSLAVFLASDQAAFITGSDIVIDGGWTAQ